MKILVVEDNPLIMEVLVLILEENGHEIEQASDGSEAIKKYRNFGPGLVMTDLVTPKSCGISLIQYIREEEMDDTPIIVLSALDVEYAKREALEAGANRYLVKPFKSKDVLAVINEYNEVSI